MQQDYWRIVKNILVNYPYTFYAFGSRVKGTAKKYSDLDLCYKEKIPAYTIVEIEEKFIESDLPFRVELIDWNLCDKDFQNLIAKDLVKIS